MFQSNNTNTLGFFNKLYRYKQTEISNQKENFFTEILAFCLDNDTTTQQQFLQLIGFTDSISDFQCTTQLQVTGLGIPDIAILINGETVIIIEVKVDSIQGFKQLQRYSEILKSQSFKQKHLVYLTKYFEDVGEEPIEFLTQIRWHQVHQILTSTTHPISIEFRRLLNEEKMTSKIQFDKHELGAIQMFNGTLQKMQTFLSLTKEVLSKHKLAQIRPDNTIHHGNFGLMGDLREGKIWSGFYQYADQPEIRISVEYSISILETTYTEISSQVDTLNWNSYESNSRKHWFIYRELSHFIKDETFNVNEAMDFIDRSIVQIYDCVKNQTASAVICKTE